MGRPAKFDRDAAVEVAMNEMWQHGYEACSVKALSETLGITRSSFYNAFESREALFEEALMLYALQSPDHAFSDVGKDEAVLPLISRVLREVCRIRVMDEAARGCLAVNSIAELVGNDERLGPLLEDAMQERIDRLERLLRQAAKNGELASAKGAKEKALALQSLIVGINMLSKVVRSEKDLWRASKLGLEGLGLYRA